MYVYTICDSKGTADFIETLNMTSEDAIRYHNEKAQADKKAKEDAENNFVCHNHQNRVEDTEDEFIFQEKSLIEDFYCWPKPPRSMQITLVSL